MARRAILRRAAFLAASLGAGCFSSRGSAPPVAVVGGDPIVRITEPGRLPSLDNPYLAPLKRHTDPPAPWEPVVGVCLAEDSRGYPLGLLDRYEVVNDEADGVDYVVTRCPLAELTAVYDRRVAGRSLTFINSGALWRDTLVIQDRETGTLWTAATGRAIHGALAGEQLRAIPAVLASSRAWSETHPRSLYLDTGDATEKTVSMSFYAASPWQGISGFKTADRRFPPKTRIFSIAEGNEALAFTEEDLKLHGCVETTLGGRPILLEWDVADDAPRAFRADRGRLEELAIVPMYWFALDRHFETVRTVDGS